VDASASTSHVDPVQYKLAASALSISPNGQCAKVLHFASTSQHVGASASTSHVDPVQYKLAASVFSCWPTGQFDKVLHFALLKGLQLQSDPLLELQVPTGRHCA
jgi:hypothetical protein